MSLLELRDHTRRFESRIPQLSLTKCLRGLPVLSQQTDYSQEREANETRERTQDTIDRALWRKARQSAGNPRRARRVHQSGAAITPCSIDAEKSLRFGIAGNRSVFASQT